MRQALATRTAAALTIALVAALAMARLAAQQQAIPGRNVNVNGGPTWVVYDPGRPFFEIVGDPWRTQAVEPECDVSSRNPAVIVCSAVDYRLVDLPGGPTNPNDPKFPHPDSWNMIGQSRDGGLTWMSRPHPGHVLDTSGTATLLKKYEFTADPMIRFGAAGVMFHVGLAATRDQTKSAIYSSTWVHLNNHEYDLEPVKFSGVVTEIATGDATFFRDRPQLALGEPTGGTCTLDVPTYDPETDQTEIVTQGVPCTPAYVAFTTFSPDGSSDIRFSKSNDLGKTWSRPISVSGQYGPVAQGAQIVKIPNTRMIVVFWRRGSLAGQGANDAIMHAVSYDNGSTWGTARVFAPICPFDQPNTYTTFRVKTMPYATAGPGRAFVVWAERGRTASGACDPNADARVMIATTNGVGATAPKMVDTSPQHQGHEIFPTVAAAAGKVHVAWMDFRNDASRIFEPYIDEWDVVTGQVPAGGERKRHTADMFAAESSASSLVFGPPIQVSQYIHGMVEGETELRQIQWNVVLARNFAKMFIPFPGDYNSSRGESMIPLDPVRLPGLWGLNLGDGLLPPRTPVFHDFWTDGRNVHLLPGGETPENCGSNGTPCERYGDNPYVGHIPRPYTPPALDQMPSPTIPTDGYSLYDKTAKRDACDPNLVGTKNLDIYTSRTTQGLYAFAPWNNKSTGFQNYPELPLGKRWRMVQRAFPLVVENTSDVSRSFRLTIADTWWIGTVASFDQFQNRVLRVDVDIPARSMSARTVYVKSLFDRVPVRIDVSELDSGAPKANGLRTTVFLNPDPTAPPNLLKPGQVDPSFDVTKYEVHDATITGIDVQDINFQVVSGQGPGEGGTWSDSGWPDPGWKTPGWKTPGWKTPGWKTEDWQDASWGTPGWKTPGWKTSGWENGGISDTEAGSGSSRFVTATVVASGNTSSAYNATVLASGADASLKYQLVVYKLYTTVATGSCEHKLIGNTQVLVNIPDYDPLTGTPGASFVLGPRETAYVVLVAFDATLRVFSDAKLPVQNVAFGVAAQPVDTRDYIVWEASGGTGEPPVPPPAPRSNLTIAPSALPNGVVGFDYSQGLAVSGGTGPYTWSIGSGSLPPGLNLSPSETSSSVFIAGPPTSWGSYAFTVRVTDSSSPALSGTQTFTIGITPAPGDIIVADGAYGLAGRLLRVAPDGSGPSVFAQLPAGSRAFDVAQDANGDFFVAVPDPAPSIVKVSRTGVVSTVYAGSPAAVPPLSNPIAIAVDSAGSIYVGDNDTDMVYRFTPNGTTWNIQALALRGPSASLRQGLDLAVESPGVVIVAYEGYDNGASYSSAIERMNFGTSIVTPILWPGMPGFSGYRPSRILGLAIDSARRFVVTDFDDTVFTPYPHAVYRISSDGTFGELIVSNVGNAPTDVEIESSGTYVISINSGQIVRVDPANAPAASVTPILTGGLLTFPNAVAIVR